jgi:hypothetical protein
LFNAIWGLIVKDELERILIQAISPQFYSNYPCLNKLGKAETALRTATLGSENATCGLTNRKHED